MIFRWCHMGLVPREEMAFSDLSHKAKEESQEASSSLYANLEICLEVGVPFYCVFF